MKLVSIDMATESRNCGVCVLKDEVVEFVGRGYRRAEHPEWLLDHCCGAAVVAVDVPFGWPVAFVEALCGYEIVVALDRNRGIYLRRATDAWIADQAPLHVRRQARPPSPFAVAADKLGATAMVGTLLLAALRRDFHLSPRERIAHPAVIEVYPAASLWAWGLPHRDLDEGEMLEGLQESFGLTICASDRETLVESRHCFDALVAALTAREYAQGNTFDPPDNLDEATLKKEGWIRVPSRLLDDVDGTE